MWTKSSAYDMEFKFQTGADDKHVPIWSACCILHSKRKSRSPEQWQWRWPLDMSGARQKHQRAFSLWDMRTFSKCRKTNKWTLDFVVRESAAQLELLKVFFLSRNAPHSAWQLVSEVNSQSEMKGNECFITFWTISVFNWKLDLVS